MTMEANLPPSIYDMVTSCQYESDDYDKRLDNSELITSLKTLSSDYVTAMLQDLHESNNVYNTLGFEDIHILFDIVLAFQHHEPMLLLYQRIARTLDNCGRSILHLAIIHCRYDFARFIVKVTEPNQLSRLIVLKYAPQGKTVLHEIYYEIEDRKADDIFHDLIRSVKLDDLGYHLLNDNEAKNQRGSASIKTNFLNDCISFHGGYQGDVGLVLKRLSESDDMSMCRKVILRPDCNLMERLTAKYKNYDAESQKEFDEAMKLLQDFCDLDLAESLDRLYSGD